MPLFVSGGGPHDIRAVHKDVYVLRNSYVTLQLPIHDGDIQWMVRPLSKWQLYKYRHSLEDNKVAIGPIDEDLNNITVIASYKEKNRHGKVQRYVNASITLRLGGEYAFDWYICTFMYMYSALVNKFCMSQLQVSKIVQVLLKG